jgi:N4-gp56 family major capsid protein
MANSTTTSLASLISPIVQEALFTANEQSVMRGLVRNYTIANNTGKVAQVPIYPVLTAEDIAEGTDLSGTSADQSITTTTKNITLKEVGIMTNLTDFIRDTSEQNVVAHLGRLFGNAIAKKMDTDLTALFSSLSVEKGPGAGAELTIENMFQAAAELRANNAPGMYYGVFHPKAIYNVKKALTNTFSGAQNITDLGNEALRQGYVGTIAGIQIFESNNVAVDVSDDAVGAVFSAECFGVAMQNDLNIEMQRNASLRAEEVVATARYGVAELFDDTATAKYGVKMTSDALTN